MNLLPIVSDKAANSYDYFPTPWQAVIWRNWGYVPVERIARALDASCEEICNAAEELGLNPKQEVDSVWEKRGFLTLIRDNWHLCTYEQILTLLNISEKTLAFILKEDDFLWGKLGCLKPMVTKPQYTSLSEEEREKTNKIAQLLGTQFQHEKDSIDNGFDFLKEFNTPLNEEEIFTLSRAVQCEIANRKTSNNQDLRMIYPYFALYGDVLIDESIDPIPERLLYEYAKAGINGIWMQGILYQLIEFPFDPSMSEGWEKRIETLRKFVARAKKFGIGIYLYFNEPRALTDDFYQRYSHLRGEKEGELYAMCTSTPEVQDYLYQSMKKLFSMVPDLAGYFSITMSENLTNCYSRTIYANPRGQTKCPRCQLRNPWEVVAEVNNIMAKGAHDANPQAKVITWTWGWEDEWIEKVIPLLTEGQIVQCTSEESIPFCIGGVEGSVWDYTMSLCGPGDKAKNTWKTVTRNGLQSSAKVQINNTWEMAAVPYIPVLQKVEEHIKGLKKQGIRHLHVSWTLGGCPSINLQFTTWLMNKDGSMKEFLRDIFPRNLVNKICKAQQKFCEGFSHYPFHVATLYYGPQNYGPMAPFFLKNTGYAASMVGFPYDDIQSWAGIYTAEIYEEEYQQLCRLWEEGVKIIQPYQGQDKQLDEMILMAQAVLCHYESAYHHIQFVNRRKEQNYDAMLRIVREERETVQQLLQLRKRDSRIGYESSNHYFYTLQDLKEKLINLAYCEEHLIYVNGRTVETGKAYERIQGTEI